MVSGVHIVHVHVHVHAVAGHALARMSERCARSRRSIMMAVCSWSCVVRGESGDFRAGTGALKWAPEP